MAVVVESALTRLRRDAVKMSSFMEENYSVMGNSTDTFNTTASVPIKPTAVYPFGLTRWGFIVVTFLLIFASGLCIVCFISAIKAIRDRRIIKKRIKERQQGRMLKEADKEAAQTGNDTEPLANGDKETGRSNGAPILMTNSKTDGVVTSSHTVQVTVHDSLDNSSNGTAIGLPNPNAEKPLHKNIEDVIAGNLGSNRDQDSTIASANNSDGDLPMPHTRYAIEQEVMGNGSQTETAEGNKLPQHESKSAVLGGENVSLSSSKEEDSSKWNENYNEVGTQSKPSKEGPYQKDGDQNPVLNTGEFYISNAIQQEDLPGSNKSTPERKKPGFIGTPPKFFSPKKRREEKLVEMSSPEGNKGLDNMAFDEAKK